MLLKDVKIRLRDLRKVENRKMYSKISLQPFIVRAHLRLRDTKIKVKQEHGTMDVRGISR